MEQKVNKTTLHWGEFVQRTAAGKALT
jgi:hypothetical protein